MPERVQVAELEKTRQRLVGRLIRYTREFGAPVVGIVATVDTQLSIYGDGSCTDLVLRIWSDGRPYIFWVYWDYIEIWGE